MNDEQLKTLHRIQETELEILKKFDAVCRKHKLTYSLAYGTLIGAIRHKGFIPWDDDIDVVMPRKDYEQLIKIWDEEATEGYYLQDYNKEKSYTNNFIKIRKNNTAFIQGDDEFGADYHTGIFIDVFPMDRLASNALGRKVQYAAFLLNLLYSRGYRSGKSGAFRVVESLLLLLPRKSHYFLRKATEEISCKWNNDNGSPLISPCTFEYCKMYFDSDLFTKIIEVPFGSESFLCTAKYDSFLRKSYGDYMELPPEEERTWRHHPVYVSFDHSYSQEFGGGES